MGERSKKFVVPDVPAQLRCSGSKDNCEKNSGAAVSQARRRRSSLMDNRSMLYAFSDVHPVLHDRDCPQVKQLSDSHFQMTDHFLKGMKLCEACKWKVYIRQGIGEDWRRINDYERFFNRMGINDRGLYLLMVVHEAKMKWIDGNTMEIRVHSDTWRVVQRGERVELWHNNYWCLENHERSMERDFHLQSSCIIERAWMLFKDICTYSYEKHVQAGQDLLAEPSDLRASMAESCG